MGDSHNLSEYFKQHQPADPQEIQRLHLLLDRADKQVQKVEADIELNQIESANGRVDFYDRITIGSGATIAALVSFLGGHSAKLQPAWLLRGALISLVLAMAASLFRNYRYPNYVLTVHKISYIRRLRYQKSCRSNFIKAAPAAIDVRTGLPIDVVKSSNEFEKSDAELKKLEDERVKLAERLRKEWTYSQNFSMTLAICAMVFLVWLAIVNF